jgi:DNA-binding NtrC family response regulator
MAGMRECECLQTAPGDVATSIVGTNGRQATFALTRSDLAAMPSILLVEDDTDVRLIFIEILFDAGYEVDAAPSVEAGAVILKSRDYDLVINDNSLVDGSGLGLADKARQRGIPALIVTGNPLDGRLDPKKYTVLGKPMRPNLLLAAIERALAPR